MNECWHDSKIAGPMTYNWEEMIAIFSEECGLHAKNNQTLKGEMQSFVTFDQFTARDLKFHVMQSLQTQKKIDGEDL